MMADTTNDKTKKDEKQEEKAKKLVLGYWKIRGLAQAIRNVLEYTKTPYVNKCYAAGDAPHFSRDEWTKEKHTLGLAFPNLPYLFDGDFKLTESHAILHYIGKKNNLCGSTETENATMNMVLGHLYDWRNTIVRLAYNPNFATLKGEYLSTTFASYAKELENYLTGKKWCLNDKLSIADFVLYEICDEGREMGGQLPSTIAAFMKQFEALPTIAEFFKSDRYMKRPFNNTMAAFR